MKDFDKHCNQMKNERSDKARFSIVGVVMHLDPPIKSKYRFFRRIILSAYNEDNQIVPVCVFGQTEKQLMEALPDSLVNKTVFMNSLKPYCKSTSFKVGGQASDDIYQNIIELGHGLSFNNCSSLQMIEYSPSTNTLNAKNCHVTRKHDKLIKQIRSFQSNQSPLSGKKSVQGTIHDGDRNDEEE